MVMQRTAIIAVGLVGMVFLAGCAGQASPAATQPTDDATQDGTIRVTGAGSAEAEPNQVVVRVAVTETAPDAVGARRQLAENVSQMRTALQELGIRDEQITTTRYDLDRYRRRPEREGDETRVQYRAYHGFEITVDETADAGTVIDTAVRNGATEIEDIQFTLSSSRRRQLKAEARASAMADARQKATQLAAAANLTVTGVETVRTTSRAEPRPVEYTETAMATPAPGDGGQTDLESGPVTVVATVHVAYSTTPTNQSAAQS